ncbi:hypothetical protein [Solwaraspora sp. WMMA2101]|uniref:hypothetical protein n=1 Tax=Solwaraspora sp. WMMA2101 TaxID=3404124 RepID=UPI003B92C743
MVVSPLRYTTPPAAAPAGSAAPPTRTRSAGRLTLLITLAVLVAATGFVAGRATTTGGGSAARAATGTDPHAGHDVGGLGVTQDGYALTLLSAPSAAGVTGELAFAILGPDGAPVTAYRTNHERDLHLVLVGRDLRGYQHLHPESDADGTWRAAVTLPTAGAYRMFADFVPAAATTPVTLGTDLLVPGDWAPGPPTPVDEATVVVDGYTVTLDGGLRPGQASQVLVWLGRDGTPVLDLERYLGAYGHLVALRHGDLGYLHVHPAPAASPSSVVAFAVQVPSAGSYELFFEFQHAGTVRTAQFSLTAY